MPLHKTPAITLKSRKWGEADRIVTFYTERFGKLRGVARGARRIKSRFGSALEPFVYCDLNLFEKQGDSLYRISQVDIRESFSSLREDLGKMAAGGRIVNLVSALTVEGDPAPGVFDALLHGLRTLQSVDDSALVVLLFQIRLLGQTGFCPQTQQCAVCGMTQGQGMAQGMFSPRSGGLICSSCASRHPGRSFPMSPGSWAFLAQASRLAPAVLTRLKATGQVRRELEAAIESFVTVVAGARLPPLDFLVAENRQPIYAVPSSSKRVGRPGLI